MSLEEILAAIPHREPFLLVDEVVERTDTRIKCRKTFRSDEYYFQGHYPQFPLVPGVLLCESAMQAAAVLISHVVTEGRNRLPVVAKMSDARFKRMVRPGETIELDVELTDRVSSAYFLSAKVTCQGELAARLDFTCMLTSMPSE